MKKIIQIGLFILLLSSFNNIIAQNIQKSTDSKTMIIYGSDECHHCIETKAYLKEKNIEYVFYDIDKNPKALQEMLSKLRNAKISSSNLGIPVVDKNGEIYTNVGDFEEFLKKLN